MAEYVRLRAPLEHGRALQQPSIETCPQVLAANQKRFSSYPAELQAIRNDAIREVVEAAYRYSRAYIKDELSPLPKAIPVVMSGHQPQLFHPGVWFKNFALDSIRQHIGSVGVNLVVDNDLCSASAVLCPQLKSDGSVALQKIPYDEPKHGIPYEMREVVSAEVFDAFPYKIGKAIGSTVSDPLVGPLWKEVKETIGLLRSMPACLAAGRHRLEHKLGLRNLELPVSSLAGLPSFSRFAASIIIESRRFLDSYNENLIQHRRVHRIRSRSHPVPELVSDGEWVELPFWLWTTSNPARRRLFAQSLGKTIQLTDRHQWQRELPANDIAGAFEELNQPSSQTRIRPRALATTMFARLFASHTFIHGIGGTKYDQLNDDIVRSFFGVEPPTWLTLTATMKLPFEHQTVSTKTVTDLRRERRELRFHPENFLPGHELAAAKNELIQEVPNGEKKRSWHRKVENLNTAMIASLEDQKAALDDKIGQAVKELPRSRILNSREYSFALFPESLARELIDLARPKNLS